MLEVSKLEVVYKKIITAVRGVSLQVGEADIVALVGLNGGGKTTTLRAISGFLPVEDAEITEGRITLDGRDITGWRPDRTARRGIAVVPERRKAFQTLTVDENLTVAEEASGPSDQILARDAAFDLFPILRKRRSVNGIYLSGGEQQMLAIAMALMGHPRLLMVDEASLGLAPRLVTEIMQTLVRINRQFGIALLIVDQNAQAVLSIAKHGYVMEGGRIVYGGQADELLEHEDVREFYLGAEAAGYRSYRDVKQYRRARRWWG